MLLMVISIACLYSDGWHRYRSPSGLSAASGDGTACLAGTQGVSGGADGLVAGKSGADVGVIKRALAVVSRLGVCAITRRSDIVLRRVKLMKENEERWKSCSLPAMGEMYCCGRRVVCRGCVRKPKTLRRVRARLLVAGSAGER